MKIRELTKEDWPNVKEFLEKQYFGGLYQSYLWGEVYESSAGVEKYFWLGVFDGHVGHDLRDGKDLAGVMMIVKRSLPFGKSWFYVPNGPIVFDRKSLNLLLEHARKLAKKEGAIFMRCEPYLKEESKLTYQYKQVFKLLGFKETNKGYKPNETLVIDLRPYEKDILAQMKSKGRYNIKIAKKHGVDIMRYDDFSKKGNLKYIDQFYNLLQQTTSRDDFSGHDKSYYVDMLKNLTGERFAHLYMAYYHGNPVAGVIVTKFGKMATYYYGASSNEHRNVMAPYLLQWQAMMDMKKQGYEYYDLLGVAPEGAKNHPWAGVTQFKEKFGGKRVKFTGNFVTIFKPLWWMTYSAYRYLRKIL